MAVVATERDQRAASALACHGQYGMGNPTFRQLAATRRPRTFGLFQGTFQMAACRADLGGDDDRDY